MEWRPAGTEVTMIRPHLREIPQVPFPAGFGIRPMHLEEAALWTDIVRDAEEFFPVADDLFAREFGDDPEAVPERCFFLTGPKGIAVGTISAWYRRAFKGEDYGRIHWVAVRPAYQGRGLGKAGLAFALSRLACWHQRAYLTTNTARLPALRLYLDFGFLPDLDEPNARAIWRPVQEALRHPALEALGL